MSVNHNHVNSLLEQYREDATPETLRAAAEELESYVRRGKTLPDSATGENVSEETLGVVARLLRQRADETERAASR